MIRQLVREFHQKFGHPIKDVPEIPPDDRIRLRARLIAEEFSELLWALFDDEDVDVVGAIQEFDNIVGCLIRTGKLRPNLVEVADALGDLAYVCEGAALEFGINSSKVLEVIHASNLAKLGPDGKPIYDESGKVVKPEGWMPPNIGKVLADEIGSSINGSVSSHRPS